MVESPSKQQTEDDIKSQVPVPAPTNSSSSNNNNPNPADPTKKDHYSYSYSYKTAADPESGVPGLNSVEVNESVTEEIGPDGSKIIRRHQQEKQVNKITQVVTQRVIKRQYIDPTTGQIIEYDPNNELFANLPPETVFEEHTVISDDNGNPPVVTTTTLSKTNPDQKDQKAVLPPPPISPKQQQKLSPKSQSPQDTTDLGRQAHQLVDQLSSVNLGSHSPKIAIEDPYSQPGNNINIYSSHSPQASPAATANAGAGHYQQLAPLATSGIPQSASFRIKSHPEDNQGYPEEKNMDYDPDPDCGYPDDDSPYEGLIQPPSAKTTTSTRTSITKKEHQQHTLHKQQQQQQQQQQQNLDPHGLYSQPNHQNLNPNRHSTGTGTLSQVDHGYDEAYDLSHVCGGGSGQSAVVNHHKQRIMQTNVNNNSNGTANNNNNNNVNGSDGSGQSTSGSSSSPVLFDTANNNEQNNKNAHYQTITNNKLQQQQVHHQHHHNNYQHLASASSSGMSPGQQQQLLNQQTPSAYATIQPQQPFTGTARQSQYSTVQQQHGMYDVADPYGMIQSHQHQPQHIHHHHHNSNQNNYQQLQQQQPIYQKTASPLLNNSNSEYEANGVTAVGGWRNPTLPEVIEYLAHSSNEIKANAAAYLQHLCYQDDSIKQETRLLGGIACLVQLLNNDLLDVYRNACGALRNLSYGKTNDENKLDIRDKGGIPALIRLLKRTQDESVKETITAVLWNLSSCEEIKEPILYEGLTALVKYVIVPYSSADILSGQFNANQRGSSSKQQPQNQRLLLSNTDYSNYPTVLTNTTGVLRNCSSNLQFSNCYEARKKLRECDGLIESLIRIVDQAVEPYAESSSSSSRHQQQQQLVIKDNMNSKCVENCMCILRNLSFRLQEIVDPNYDRDVKPLPSENEKHGSGGSSGGKCAPTSNSSSSKNKKKNQTIEEEFLASVYPYNMPVPNDGRAQEILWSLVTLNKYLLIIKESTVRDTIEAAVGCLQNLTACYWRPSVVIRQEIRKLKGLPTLVHLLKSDEFEDEPIVSVTAIALRNLAIDSKNKELIGKYAMRDLVAKLPDPSRPVPMRLSVLNEDTITAALACINECIKSSGEFVKSCYNEGGVKRMVFITRNGQHFPIKIVKYSAHVLTSMWKHKHLHELLKRDGYKETDFTSVAKQMGLKSHSSSPANTLHRPRGDVNVKPSHHAPSNQKKKGGSKNTASPVVNGKSGKSNKSSLKGGSGSGSHSRNEQQVPLNEMPIYSQVQKNGSGTNNNTAGGGSNKNLVISNGGQTNADSWV